MIRKKKTPEEERNDPIKKMEDTRKERKLVQVNNWMRYNDAKTTLREEIEENQGVDIMEDMLQQRRDWINEYKQMHQNKIPEDIKPFYDRFNTQAPLSPEEEAAKKAEEDEAAAAKGKKKGAKKAAKKKKGKKGKKGDGEEKLAVVKIGPTEVVTKFDNFYDEFNEDWINRDESGNQEQKHDEAKAREDVLPSIEEEYKQNVDDMIKMELENMKTLSGVKAKKKKKKKKGKKKKKKKKGLKLPGYKQIKDMQIKEILVTLI